MSNFIKSSAVALMDPDALVEFNRQIHGNRQRLDIWGEDAYLSQGLTRDEKALLAQVPWKKGRVLVLCGGGGLEAISLAQQGFEVLLVDYIPELVESAQRNAARYGVKIDGMAQEISQLELPPGSFELSLLLNGTYSYIPTRTRRIATLRKVNSALKPGGYCLCQFLLDPDISQFADVIYKAISFITSGNFWYEKGDRIVQSEYMHIFTSENDLKDEFKQGGFELLHFMTVSAWSGAVLRRCN